MRSIRFFLFIIAVLLIQVMDGQPKPLIDSLLPLFKTTPKDTNHVKWGLKLSQETMYSNTKLAKEYCSEALTIAKEKKWDKGIANCYHIIGYIYLMEGNTSEALIQTQEALKIRKKNNDIGGMARSYGNLGTIYNYMSQYPKALEYQLKSLKLNEEVKNDQGIAACLSNIGNIYSNLKKPLQSLDYQMKALEMNKKLQIPRGIAGSLMNVGNSYLDLSSADLKTLHISHAERMKKVYAYKYESLGRWLQTGEVGGIVIAYQNMGDLYTSTKIADSALSYYKKALDIYESAGEQVGAANIMARIGGIYYLLLSDNKNAEQLLVKSLAIAQKTGGLELERDASKVLSDVYREMNNPSKALLHYTNHIKIRDSLMNEESAKKIVQQQMQYEFAKILVADSLKLLEEKRVSVIKLNQQKTVSYFAIFAVISLIIVVFLVFRNLRATKKISAVIFEKKKEVEIQKHLVEEKNKEIIDSINYAKRLQDAAIPSPEYFQSLLPNSFIYYNPKDIVAGDFYWVYQLKEKNKLLVAAADCTGHGVPGALVSIVCLNALNRCVEEFKLSDPSKILDKTTEIIQQSFRLEENDVKDGMDIALALLDFEKNEGTFSGANNPLWILSNGILNEIKGDSQPVGKQYKPQPFTQHTFKFKKMICLYYLPMDTPINLAALMERN
ncbi:MAG: tetratricopeptide repeat protein [Sphingobacteriaceae bacterium]|nr:tetratricopeptide repeat protein [Sphingobacteriaceae bacterium]